MIATSLKHRDFTAGGVAASRHRAWARAALPAMLVLTLFALFARLMAFPVRHDEQMYVPVGALLMQGDLYRDFGFNNLPNFPLALGFIFQLTATDHYLLVGRLMIFAAWLLFLVAIMIFVRRAAGTWSAAALAALLVATNPVLIGPAGMLATNNFLPLAFAMAATTLLIAGLDRSTPQPWVMASAGLCIAVAAGFKANYVYMIPLFAATALIVPLREGLSRCLARSVGPLAVGGLIGSLPVLYYLFRDADGFLVHVIQYHRGPHVAYWAANPSLDGPKIMTLSGKLLLAIKVWLGGGFALVVCALALLGWNNVRHAEKSPRRSRRALWPIALLTAILIGGMMMSFVPTPAFPQYYILPLPFLIALAALLYGRLPAHRRSALSPLLLMMTIVAIAWGLPRLVVKLPDLVRPERWAGIAVHRAGQQLARYSHAEGADGPVATLAPLYPLEGGMTLYPELAAGPLVYRVGDLIPPQDQRHYRIISPHLVGGLMRAQPPVAILVGQEGRLDEPFIAYAREHGYRLADPALVDDRYGKAALYVRPHP